MTTKSYKVEMHEETVTCTFRRKERVKRLQWSLELDPFSFAWLLTRFGDVSQWANEQFDLVQKGHLPFAQPIMIKIIDGTRIAPSKTSEIVGAYVINLILDECPDF